MVERRMDIADRKLEAFKNAGYYTPLKMIRRRIGEDHTIRREDQKLYTGIMREAVKMGLNPVTLQEQIEKEVLDERERAEKDKA